MRVSFNQIPAQSGLWVARSVEKFYTALNAVFTITFQINGLYDWHDLC
jgi:hypothetical protein